MPRRLSTRHIRVFADEGDSNSYRGDKIVSAETKFRQRNTQIRADESYYLHHKKVEVAMVCEICHDFRKIHGRPPTGKEHRGFRMKKLNIWFEHNDTLCIEFAGEYDPNAAWYRPFQTRMRMELGAKDPHGPVGWVRGSGGTHAAVWRLSLASDSLRAALTVPEAYAAVHRAAEAFNSYPHDLGIIVEA